MTGYHETAVRGKLRTTVVSAATAFGLLGAGMGIAGAFSACKGTPGDRNASQVPERAAVLRVVAGEGRLAGGEEFVIAEWRAGTREAGSFADFRGQDGGPTLDLALSGLGVAGTHACDGSGGASLRLGVDVSNIYVPAEGECRLVVERVANGVAEGRYEATLRHVGNAGDVMKVSGTFRATTAQGIAAAKAPKIVGR